MAISSDYRKQKKRSGNFKPKGRIAGKTAIDDVKAYIKNSEYDDGFYAQAINQASRMVEKITQKNFWFHNHRITPFRPRDIFDNKVFFPFPIRAISSLTIEGVAVGVLVFVCVGLTVAPIVDVWVFV